MVKSSVEKTLLLTAFQQAFGLTKASSSMTTSAHPKWLWVKNLRGGYLLKLNPLITPLYCVSVASARSASDYSLRKCVCIGAVTAVFQQCWWCVGGCLFAKRGRAGGLHLSYGLLL